MFIHLNLHKSTQTGKEEKLNNWRTNPLIPRISKQFSQSNEATLQYKNIKNKLAAYLLIRGHIKEISGNVTLFGLCFSFEGENGTFWLTLL